MLLPDARITLSVSIPQHHPQGFTRKRPPQLSYKTLLPSQHHFLSSPHQPSHHIPQPIFLSLTLHTHFSWLSCPPRLTSCTHFRDPSFCPFLCAFHPDLRLWKWQGTRSGTWSFLLTKGHFSLRPNECRHIHHGVNRWICPQEKD